MANVKIGDMIRRIHVPCMGTMGQLTDDLCDRPSDRGLMIDWLSVHTLAAAVA
jgi:hypothetical protein